MIDESGMVLLPLSGFRDGPDRLLFSCLFGCYSVSCLGELTEPVR